MERGSDSQSRGTHSPDGTFAPEIRFRVGRKLRKRGGALVRERRGGAAWAWARPEPSRPAPGRFRVSPYPGRTHLQPQRLCAFDSAGVRGAGLLPRGFKLSVSDHSRYELRAVSPFVVNDGMFPS